MAIRRPIVMFIFFFFNDTATTEIYTLSLHDALPIYAARLGRGAGPRARRPQPAARLHPRVPALLHRRGGGLHLAPAGRAGTRDRKSTRLNSSHLVISYAVFCLKKKKKTNLTILRTRI